MSRRIQSGLLPALQAKLACTKVSLREVGLREGLQSASDVLETDAKLRLFEGLRAAGARELNAVAFVNPAKMPQMADAEDLLRSLGQLREGVLITALVPNDRGMRRALAMRAEGLLDGILLVFAASRSLLGANGMTASLEQLQQQIARNALSAAEAGLAVSVFISASYGCSIEGRIDPQFVVESAARLRAAEGVSEIVISDSTGQADPLQVMRLLSMLATALPLDERLGVHFHDTRGAGLANVLAALASPFRRLVLDSSFGGWGGDYPFIPEALGNVATEDLVEMLLGMGVDVGIDVEQVMEVAREYAQLSGRRIGARLHASSPIGWKHEMAASGGVG